MVTSYYNGNGLKESYKIWNCAPVVSCSMFSVCHGFIGRYRYCSWSVGKFGDLGHDQAHLYTSVRFVGWWVGCCHPANYNAHHRFHPLLQSGRAPTPPNYQIMSNYFEDYEYNLVDSRSHCIH